MPRPPRLDAPGTIHHVWSRAVEGRDVFVSEVGHRDFLDRMSRCVADADAGWLAWAIMSNHFHGVIQTGSQPLRKLVHRLKTGFAVTFNRRFQHQGHVFQGRFKSRPATDDADVMGLIRYVHRNPLKAGLVRGFDALADYPWCGHGALMGRRAPLPFEAVSTALSFFGSDLQSARTCLAEFMERPEKKEPSTLEQLITAVCLEHGVSVDDLRSGRRNRATTSARTLICQLAVNELGLRQVDVAGALEITDSAVFQALKRSPGVSKV
jgi:REP element-mobilizing transposase RayT